MRRRFTNGLSSGRVVLAALTMALVLIAAPVGAIADCSGTSSGLIPLTDLGTGEYQGAQGGLYPGGTNEIPAEHLALGLELGQQVVPRAPDGTPSADGLIIHISIGVSNTLAQTNGFLDVIAGEGGVNHNLLVANTAQTGRALGQWAQQSSDTTWNRADRIIRDLGGTNEQVQVGWMMLPSRTRGPRTLDRAAADLAQVTQVVQTAKARYPNLALLYVSSRMYGGYIPDSDSEPNAYLHGFTVKWLIEEQINGSAALNADPDAGPVMAPWLAWGPYLWADGLTPRNDGLTWECSDYATDGVHPAETTGAVKVGQLLYDHYLDDPTATWFEAGEGAVSPPTTEAAPETTVSEELEPAPDTSSPDTTRARQDAPTTDRVRRNDQRNDRAAAQLEETREGWPVITLIGVGLGGVVLGAIAGSAGTRLWLDRNAKP